MFKFKAFQWYSGNLPENFKGVSNIFQGCFNNISWVFHGCFKDASRMSMEVAMVSQNWLKGIEKEVSKEHQAVFKVVSVCFHGCVKNVSKVSPGIFWGEDLKGVSRNF